MSTAFPYQALFFLLFFFLFLKDERWAVLSFLICLVLFDRNFAYVQLQVHGKTMYITEYILFLWILKKTLHPDQLWQTFRNWPTLVQAAWVLYMTAGLISFSRGIQTYSALSVFRDAALCYYALFALLAASLDITADDLHTASAWLGAALFVKTAFILLDIARIPIPHQFDGQPAASSLILCIGLLFILALTKFQLSKAQLLGTVLMTSAMLVQLVRSSWIGFGTAILVLSGSFIANNVLSTSKVLRGLVLDGIIIGLGSSAVIGLLSWTTHIQTKTATVISAPQVMAKKPEKVVIGPQKSTVKPAPTQKAPPTPESIPTAQILSAPVPKVTPTPASIPVSRIPPTRLAVPLPPPPSQKLPLSPWEEVGQEMASFLQGTHTDNAQTRFWMWEDAISEVFSIGLFSPSLKFSDLQGRSLPADVLVSEGKKILKIPVTGQGLQNEHIYIRLSEGGKKAYEEPFSRHLARMAFGVPFGKLYLPPQVVWRVNSAHRYEPHNSVVDILYRMGVLGLSAFVILLVAIRRSLTEFIGRWRLSGEFPLLWWLAALAGITCHVVHSLMDNGLENPFKGSLFWLMVGFVFAVRRAAPDVSEVMHNNMASPKPTRPALGLAAIGIFQ